MAPCDLFLEFKLLGNEDNGFIQLFAVPLDVRSLSLSATWPRDISLTAFFLLGVEVDMDGPAVA